MAMSMFYTLLLLLACAATACAQAVTLTVLDPSGGSYHAHPVGTAWSIQVTARWTGGGSVYWQWQNADKQAIGGGPTALSAFGRPNLVRLRRRADRPV